MWDRKNKAPREHVRKSPPKVMGKSTTVERVINQAGKAFRIKWNRVISRMTNLIPFSGFFISFALRALILLDSGSEHSAGVDAVWVPAQTQIPIRNLGREINGPERRDKDNLDYFSCFSIFFFLARLCAYFFDSSLDINEIKLIKRRL